MMKNLLKNRLHQKLKDEIVKQTRNNKSRLPIYLTFTIDQTSEQKSCRNLYKISLIQDA